MDKKLSCIHLGHKRIPSREGGIEIVVEELASRMVQRGIDVTCLNRGGTHVSGEDIKFEKLKEYRGIRLKNVLTINIKGLAAMSASVLGAIVAAFSKADVVHFHAEGPCVMLWLPKLFGKRCIATIHGLDHQRAKWGRLAKAYIMLGEKGAVKHANEIIVLSENVERYFREVYGRETCFIPNGVSSPRPKKADIIQRKYELSKDEYVLYLGRLVPEKGIQYLIEAFKDVKTAKKLVIAGGASDTTKFANEMKALAQADQRIIFTGFVEGEILEELYSNAYIYVLPSDLEGMSLSLLEAMSYGNCCLTSDIPECMEVVSDKAVTFPKSNVKKLRKKLQILCDDPEQVGEYKKVAKDYILGKYDWDEVVDKTLVLYHDRGEA